MSLETALVAELKAHTGLAALISTRIYPLVIPQGGTLPCVTYQRISTRRFHCLRSDADLDEPRIQFDCWATTYGGAKSVAAQLISALRNKLGTIGSGSNKVTGSAVLIQTETDMYEDDTQYYRVSVDFRIQHKT